MYVQWFSLEYHSPQCAELVKNAKALSLSLKKIAKGMLIHDCYIIYKWGESPVNDRVQPALEDIEPQRKRNVILTLMRADIGEKPVDID